MKTYKFHVRGMHCPSCVILTESKLTELDSVSEAKAELHTRTVEVVGEFGDRAAADIAAELSKVLDPHGYSLSIDNQEKVTGRKWSDFKIALPLALAFGLLYFWLQKSGILNSFSLGSVSYGTAFTIGIIASLSSCMAVVGGLLLSMSATFAKEGDKIKPQLFFHVGRIVSFFVLGGVIGIIGSAFTLSLNATVALNIIIALVMLSLGINLLEVFHFSKRLQPAMPKFISKHALGISKLNHRITPLLLGIATFFLPCGFTQAMQISALKAGGFLAGGLTMLAFAFGTLPVLALVSFGFSGLKDSAKKSVFFKTAGLIVVMFAIVNLLSTLALLGVIPPLFNF
jgi:uncharacterized protein